MSESTAPVSSEVVTESTVAAPVATDTAPVTEAPVKAKRTRKPASAKAKSKPKVAVKRGRGRPIVFKGNEKRHIVSVIRKHGLTKGREILAGEKVSISLPTLGKFAAEAGIELHRGRPSKAA